MGMPAGPGVTQYICRTGIGQRVALAVCAANCHVIVRIALARAEPFDLRIDDIVRLRERRVVQPRDVRAARPDIVYLLAAYTNHAAAGNANDPDIQRIHIRVVAAYPGMSDGWAAIADYADVGAGTADLEINAIGHAQVHERTGHARRRTRQHGYDRAPSHFLYIHDTAIAAHDHQRRGDAGFAHGLFRHVGRADHLRQDAGVDDGSACPRGESIQLGDFVATRHCETEFGCNAHDCFLGALVIDAEGAARHHDLRAFIAQRDQRLAHDGFVEFVRGDETMGRPQNASRRQ